MKGQLLHPNCLASFVQGLRHQKWTRQTEVLRIGICVSGGPDSMALAYLLRQLQRSEEHGMELFGFIVDHKARVGSTTEAQTVRENLLEIGIESSVLTMTWPEGIDPLRLSGFESQAREKRYQLLASAARRKGVQHLCLGHHRDDQVETILMRLIRNQTSSLKGLAGMAVSSPVPGAYELFGVHVAQDSVVLPACKSFPASKPFRSFVHSAKRQHKNFQVTVPGGMYLQRPLLAFPKLDLVETCRVHNIPHVIDPTNQNPRSTLRNAVRHMRTNFQLPKALGEQRILHLQQTSQDYIRRVKKAGEAVLSGCGLVQLDLRSGVTVVDIPYQICDGPTDTEGYSYAVSKLVEIVTPSVRVNRSMQVAAHILSNFCGPLGAKEQAMKWPPSSFSYDGVLFTPDIACPQRWTLSRQPMRNSEIERHTKSFVCDTHNERIRPSISKWLLWDNRYWMRIRAQDIDAMEDFQVRPLQERDISTWASLTRDTRNHSQQQIARLLKDVHEAAPGKIRYTMPVITFRDHVVALPTLRHKPLKVIQDIKLDTLDWDIRYNAFDLVSQLAPRNSAPCVKTRRM